MSKARRKRKKISRVDIELYQHSSQPISVQNEQKLYYKTVYKHGKCFIFVKYHTTKFCGL